MAERIRAHDWASTPLGPIEAWPQSLKSVVDLMLCSRQPAYIAFGPALTALYNDAYIAILGTGHPKSLGQPYSEVWPELWPKLRPIIEATLAGEAQHFIDHPIALRGCSGRPTGWFTCSWTPLRDEAGAVKGFYCSATETTAQVLAQTALRESEEWLRFSLRGAGAAAWQWDFLTKEMVWSPESYELHGRDPELGKPGYEDWLHCLHPDDRAKVEKICSDAIEKGSPEYRTEYRVVFPSGEVRWLDALGRVDYAADGSPLRMSGINLDITARKRAEEALRLSEERLRFCMKEAGAAAWQSDISTRQIIWSAECCELHGRDPKLGSPQYDDWYRCMHPEDRDRAEKANLDALIRIVPKVKMDYRVVLPTGEIRWLEALGKVEYAPDGWPLRMSGIILDITEPKRTEEALRIAEELQRQKRQELETILAAIPAAVLITKDASCTEMTGNPAAYDLLELPAGTNLSKSAPAEQVPDNFEIFQNGCRVAPEDLPIRKASDRKCAVSGEELELRFADGQSKFLIGNALPLFDGAGEVRGAVAAFTDITELKRTEAALRESETRLKFALDAAGAGTWEVALEAGRLTVSDRALALKGLPPGTPITHEKALAAVHPDDKPRFEEAFRHTREMGELFRVEYRIPLPDGSIRWLESRGELRCVSGKQVISGLVLDITDRKRTELALHESKERLKFALAAAKAGTGEIALETGEVFASERSIALLNMPQGMPLTPETALAGLHPDDRDRVIEAFERTHATGESYRLETRVPLPDGSVRWLESHGELRIVAGKRIIGGLVQDITERKRAEVALRESEELLRSIIEHVPVPILLSREDRKILLINPVLTELTGYTLADIPTRDEWETLAYRDGAQQVKENVRDAFERGIPADRGELWIHTKSGEKRLWAINTAPAGRDASGKRLMVSVGLDITERKRSEDALASALRLEAVGKLAGGVAHDFNNLLAVIAGNLELAEDRIDDDTVRDLIRRALNAAEKGGDLNRRLLSLASKRVLKSEKLSLNRRVEETAKLLKSTLGEDVEVTTDLAVDLWMTLADPGEIDSALLNVAANARDAMPNGGKIRIWTTNVTVDAVAAAKFRPEARAGQYVRLAVADDGVGMTQEVLGKAMEPFFTTKGPGAGTGLGLASVASFAKQTGGFAGLESGPGRGCIVSLYLPRSGDDALAPDLHKNQLPLGSGELVLVVEDDDQVREVTLKRIESLGYAVAEARTGPEAIRQLKSEEPVLLVLSDIVMPGGMTGYDVARWVASNKPEIQVILCSGYNEEDNRGDVRSSLGDVVVLGKPYSRDRLARALSNALTPPKMD